MSSGLMRISNSFLNLIIANLEKGKTILEFGSGDGTQKLISHGYKVYSVEQDEKYCNLHHDNYLHAELNDGWYNNNKVVDFVRGITYDAILIDGPASGDRRKIIDCFGETFFENALLFIDDIERKNDRKLFDILKQGREYTDFKKYGVIL
jgi:precorrin-6B methylase 2